MPGNRNHHDSNETITTTVAIAGAGIVGLTLALALRGPRRHLLTGDKVRIDIYEKAVVDTSTQAGAGMSMYPNGLRVLGDIDSTLLEQVRQLGITYQARQWTNSRVPMGQTASNTATRDNQNKDLKPLGLCRWKLQQLLQKRVAADPAIRIHYGAAIVGADEMVQQVNSQKRVRIHLVDGQTRYAAILFGCDGAKSVLRRVLLGTKMANQNPLVYSGVTCLMGLAPRSSMAANVLNGITQVSSLSSSCKTEQDDFNDEKTTTASLHDGTHAVFFPTSHDQVCFQFHIPTPEAAADALNWDNLSQSASRVECRQLAQQLRCHGWHESYLQPLEQVQSAVKIGFMQLEKPLHLWTMGNVVLLGDAAHPPTPFIGQGLQQGLEDVGVCISLLEHYCWDPVSRQLNWDNFSKAMTLYEDIRLPRCDQISEFSRYIGRCQSTGCPSSSVLKSEVAMNGVPPLYNSAANDKFQNDAHQIIKSSDRQETPSSVQLETAFDKLFVQSPAMQVRRWSMQSVTKNTSEMLHYNSPRWKALPRISTNTMLSPQPLHDASVASFPAKQGEKDVADESPRGILEEAAVALQQQQGAKLSLSNHANKSAMPTINLEIEDDDDEESFTATALFDDSHSLVNSGAWGGHPNMATSLVVDAILEENWGSIDTSGHYLMETKPATTSSMDITDKPKRRLSIMEEANAALEAMEMTSEADESDRHSSCVDTMDDPSFRLSIAKNTVQAIHDEVVQAMSAMADSTTVSSVVTELEEARGTMEALQAIQYGMKENTAMFVSLQENLDHVREALQAITLGMERNASLTKALHMSLEEARHSFRAVTAVGKARVVRSATADKQRKQPSKADHYFI